MNTLKRIANFVLEHKLIFILSSVGLLISILIFCAVATKDIDAEVKTKTWQRDIVVQKYDWVHKNHSSEIMYHSVPSGARDVNRWISTHSHRRSRTTYTGSGENRRSHTDYYYVHDTEYHVSYSIQEWTFSRTVTINGTAEKEVVWPEVQYGSQPPEREGSKIENFTITFYFPYLEKEKVFKTNNYTIYSQIDVNRSYKCSVNYFGFIKSVNGLHDWN